ncbi:MAG: hypothetical protein MZU97_13320 [Bacillus subtilis]|nr:hypothetical protein [Bacillus subtilis]
MRQDVAAGMRDGANHVDAEKQRTGRRGRTCRRCRPRGRRPGRRRCHGSRRVGGRMVPEIQKNQSAERQKQ